jgi:hypothetical protein
MGDYNGSLIELVVIFIFMIFLFITPFLIVIYLLANYCKKYNLKKLSINIKKCSKFSMKKLRDFAVKSINSKS